MLSRFAWILVFFLNILFGNASSQTRSETLPSRSSLNDVALSSTSPSSTDVDEPYIFIIDTLQDYYFDITLDALLVAVDSTDSWTIEQASATETEYMYVYDYHAQHGAFEPYSTYWGKIRIKNTLTDNIKGILEVSPKNSFVDVYIRQHDGSFSLQRTGKYLPVSERAIQADVGNSVWVDLPADETQEIHIKIKRITGFTPRFGLSLSTPQYWIHHSKSFNDIVTGFIEGALVIMAVFFLFYFITSKDKTYLYYSLFLFSIAVYYLFDYQYYYADALLGKYIYFKLHLWLLTSVYAVFLILFARSFLNIPKRFPLLDKVFRWMIGVRLSLLAISLVILTWNYDFDLVDRIYAMGYNNLEVPLWLVIIGYLAFKRPNWADRIMLLGVSIFILCIGFVLLTFQTSGLYEYQRWIPYSYNIGFTAQVICLSVALGIRQRISQQQENTRLEKKVAERTEQIQEQTVRLQKLNSFRSRLLANVSHEFRTPLTLIINPLTNLIKAENGNTSKKTLLSQMKSHAQTLLQFVEELLILSRIETDTFILDRKKADVVAHLRPALFLFYDLAERKGVKYRIELPTQPVTIDADLAKITMIVNNLLSNAFKFTSPGDGVRVVIRAEGAVLYIIVRDEGIGIAPQEQARIFDRFYQSENSREYSVSGTGIGLSLTQEIVKLHGGTVKVESQLGEGSTFTVSLPVVIPNTESVVQQESYPLRQTLKKGTAPLLLEAPQVLIVEDNIHMRQYLRECLQSHYRLLMATDGQEGQQIAEIQLPDLIITDLAMPRQDGMQLTQTLKNNLLTSHIPIIMLTAWADSEHQTRGWEHGSDAYITKPFDDDLLRARIKNLLEERARLKEYYHHQLFQAKNVSNSIAEKSNDTETNPFLGKLKEAIEVHYSNSSLDVEILSDEVALSSSHLNRKLKSLINQSTSEFIRSYRLGKAAELLTTSGYNIAEVAYRVGFDNPSYFTLRFREHFGCSPSQYQKRAKNEV